MDAGAQESEHALGGLGRVASRLDLAFGRAVGGQGGVKLPHPTTMVQQRLQVQTPARFSSSFVL
jgi:hypothetical protein